MAKVKGSKKGYVDPSSLVPDSGTFNPHDYIDPSNYKLNRRGRFLYESDLAQLQYLADLRQQEFQNQYASPVEEVARMRAAGINPDIQGLSGAQSAAGPSHPESPMSGLETNFSVGKNIFDIVMTVPQLVLSMSSGIQALKLSSLENLSSEADLVEKLINLEKYSAVVGGIGSLSKLPLSRRMKRKVERVNENISPITRQSWNAQMYTDFNKSYNNLFDSNFEYGLKSHNKYYNPYDTDSSGVIDSIDWAYIFDPLAKFAEQKMMSDASTSARKSKVENDYWNQEYDGQSLGTWHGKSDLIGFYESFENQLFSGELRGPMREVVNRLAKKRDQGNDFATFALIAMFFATQMSGSLQQGKGFKLDF